MKSHYNIALIIPYFGKFNQYFPVFLESCGYNSSIDWLIFTDSEDEYSLPENVKKIKMSFEEFRRMAQEKFSYDISLERPYKLCDFRPAYGEILKDYLDGYDFWGYCDCDLIFGNIRKFVTDEILCAYDKIFTRGHLTLFRNNSQTNLFYKEQNVIDARRIYTSERNCKFDEWTGISTIWEAEGRKFYDEMPFDDLLIGLEGFYPTKRIGIRELGGPYHYHNIDLYRRYKRMKNIVYSFSNGSLFRVWRENKNVYTEEVLYVHLQKRKMNFDIMMEYKKGFLICPGGFKGYVSELCLKDLKKLSPGPGIKDMYALLRGKITRIVKKYI
jgi:hypothetical protein